MYRPTKQSYSGILKIVSLMFKRNRICRFMNFSARLMLLIEKTHGWLSSSFRHLIRRIWKEPKDVQLSISSSFPSPGWIGSHLPQAGPSLIVNTDGACLLQDSGPGFFLRYHYTTLLAGRSLISPFHPPIQCEALAIWEGLHAAIRLGHFRIQLETDALTIQEVLDHGKNPPWRIWHILADTRRLIDTLQSLVSFCYKECNRAAHWAATKARQTRSNFLWEENFNPSLADILYDDLHRSFGRCLKP